VQVYYFLVSSLVRTGLRFLVPGLRADNGNCGLVKDEMLSTCRKIFSDGRIGFFYWPQSVQNHPPAYNPGFVQAGLTW
jgi:hypothetical protein